jgi:hypothetical protein
MRSLIICVLHQTLLQLLNRGRSDGWSIYCKWECPNINRKLRLENLKRRDLKDTGRAERVILKWCLKKQGGWCG